MILRLLTLKLFLLISAFSAFSAIFAQDTYWNFVIDNAPFTRLTQVLPTSDNGLIVASDKITHQCLRTNVITKLDSTGQEIWTLPWSSDPTIGVQTTQSLLELPNGDIVVAGGPTGSGDVYGDIPIFFQIISPNGIPKVQTTVYNHFSFQLLTFPTSTAILNDEQILMSIYDSLFVVDTSGVVLDSLDFSTFDSIQSIHVLEEDRWLLQARNQLYMSDDSTNILANFSTENNILNCELIGNSIYVLTSEHIWVLDENLEVLNSKNFANNELYPSLFIAANDEVWLKVYEENSEQLVVGLLDNNLDFVNSSSIPPDLFEIENIELAVGNKQFFLTSERFGHLSISAFDKNNFDYLPIYEDIEIVDITVDSLNVMDWSDAHSYRAFTQVSIQNNGPDTLRQLALFFDTNWGAMCNSGDIYFLYTDLVIASNEIEQLFLEFSDAIYGGLPQDLELCLTCKAPNQNIETIIDNNTFCKTETAYLSTPSIQSSSIHLYPNPCQEQIFIDAKSVIERLSIFELSGKKVWESKTPYPPSSIDISYLTNGVYFVKIVSDGQVYLEKIIKN